MRHRDLPFTFLAILLFLVESASSQQGIAIPGSPKGDLQTELLQSRGYCRSMERALSVIEERFPSLTVETLAANASWKSSPFALGCNAIEEDIIKDAGDKGRAMLKKLDEDTWAAAVKYMQLTTVDEAREFLSLVDRRAKGQIEVDMVRGSLLSQYRPFQENPEKEVGRGYVQKITHTAPTVRKIVFEVPMSWKCDKSSKNELMTFRSSYGHGNVWVTVLVRTIVDKLGQPMTAQVKFEECNEEAFKTEYRSHGVDLTSFSKTKVNGMSALMFTHEQTMEQLGKKARRASQVIRAFTGSQMINLQMDTLDPEDDTKANEWIKKNEALFKMVGSSLRVVEP